MKNIFTGFVITILFWGNAYTQFPGCPGVVAGPDQTVCSGQCANVTAVPVAGAQTTTYTVGSIPYVPFPYTGANNIIINVDDVWSGAINIPFTFCFFGNAYNQLVVGSNGCVSFNMAYAGGFNAWQITAAVPNAGNAPINSILGPWHDIDPSINQAGQTKSVNWQVYGTAPCRVMVVSFRNIPMYSGGCNGNVGLNATHQIAIYETTNIVEVYIQSKQLCPGWNSGRAIEAIQNAAGTVAFIVPGRNSPTQWSATNDGWRFTPAGAPNYVINWFDGVVNIGTGPTIQVCPNVTTTYTAQVTYTNCNGTQVNVTDPVTITVNQVNFNWVFNPVNNVTCPGGNNGAAVVAVTGGAPNYVYNWNNGNVGPNANNLPAGTYVVTVTDANGCSGTNQVTITEPPPIQINFNPTPVPCNGQATGAATAAAIGGNGAPFTFAWNNGQTGPTATNLVAGTYTVTVTDALGCTQTAQVTINQPAVLNVVVNGTDPTCNGGNNGTATANPNGGTPGFTYVWNTGGTTQTINGLGIGTYTVTVTDLNGCTATGQVTLNQPNPMQIVVNGTDPLCNGVNNGTATAAANGGTGPYNYLWNNGGNTATINNLAAGTYTVTATDQNGCTVIGNITLNNPPSLIVNMVHTDVNCNGNADGIATANPSGGTAPYNYVWTNGGVTQTVNGLAPGTYDVTVTDQNGCTGTGSVTITEPSPIVIILNRTDVACANAATGAINGNVSGGNGNYSFLWSPGNYVTLNISGLTAGTYTLTVTDVSNANPAVLCQYTQSVTINQPAPLVVNAISTNVTCNGYANGTASANANGGVGPYTYAWNNGMTTSSITGIPAGLYTVTVTDANGCTKTASTLVTEPTPVNASIQTFQNATCFGLNNGTATVAANGGTGAYSYFWSTTPGQVSQTASNLLPGTWIVTVTDQNGCTGVTSVVITEPAAIVVTTYSIDIGCNAALPNGEAFVSAIGGQQPFSYVWSNGATGNHISNLNIGTYYVTVTDGNNCTSTSLATVNLQPSPTVVAGPDGSFCEGSGGVQISCTASGGTSPYYYTWTCNQLICGLDSVFDNDPIANPSITTTYYIQVVDFNGCLSNVDSLVVVVLPKPVANAGPDLYICGDSAPCQLLTPSITNAPGPYIFNWTPAYGLNDPTLQNPCARPDTTTIYALVVTSSNGCTSDYNTNDTVSTVVVHVNPTPVANAGPDMDICLGEVTMLQGIGYGAGPLYDFEWSPANGLSSTIIANPSASPIFTTDYILTVWSNGCPSFGDTVTINVHTIPTVDAGPDWDICYNEPVTVHATASGDLTATGYDFNWTPTTGIIGASNLMDAVVSPTVTTTYFVIATSNWGCESAVDSVLITVKPTPFAEAGPSITLCSGTSVQLDGSYFYMNNDTVPIPSQIYYSWTPAATLNDSSIADPLASPQQTIQYYLTVNYNTCSTLDSVLISIIPTPVAALSVDTTNICQGDSVQLNASGGLGGASFNWTPGTYLSDSTISNPYASPADTTQYTIIIDQSGCRDTVSVWLNTIPRPVLSYLSSLTAGCVPFDVSFLQISNESISFTWDFGDGTISNENNPLHTYSTPGDYIVSLIGSNSGGCKTELNSMLIHVIDTAHADFTSNPEFPVVMSLPNTEVAFKNISLNAVSYEWNFGDGIQSDEKNPIHFYTSEGSYNVMLEVENSLGCVSRIIHGPYIIQTPEVFIPNVFSPNNDGINDEFLVKYTGSQPFLLMIFDRWGNQLHSARDKYDGWKGQWKSSDVPSGVYFYTVKVGDKEYSGPVTLVR